MPDFPPVDEQLAVLLRGAAQVETEAELRKKLTRSRETGKPLRVKYGIDPTGFDVHLGHTVPLRKLRQFQELGHTAVLIIGTATAEVGDPSGRDDSRAGLTPEQIRSNATRYLEQIRKVVDVDRAEVRPNGDWFHRFDFAAMLKLLGSVTVQRMLERDDFAKRLTAGTPIYLHECLYPLMQGHDSVEIRADVELGGTEQLFNLMVGRRLQTAVGQEPQICLTMPILRGLDGEKKMGKSLGNYIGLAEGAKEQFGKAMSIPDTLLREWLTLLTNRSNESVNELLALHPKDAKLCLASDIVADLHGYSAALSEIVDDMHTKEMEEKRKQARAVALAARAEWVKQFSEKLDPDYIADLKVPIAELTDDGKVGVMRALVLAGMCRSNSEARKKVEEGAVNVGPDRQKVTDFKATLPVMSGLVLRMGRKMVRLVAG